MTAKRRGGRPPDLAKRAEAARLRAQGLTYRQVAGMLGVSVGRAYQLLNDPKNPVAIPASVS